MKRVALFFGSFNPIHNGHIHIAQEVLRHQKADEVHFVLSPQNPHKSETELLAETHRWDMLQLALQNHKALIPNSIELQLSKPSFTAKTLRKLVADNPTVEYALLLGADNETQLHTWDDADYLMQFPRYVYPRKGIVLPESSLKMTFLDVELQEISATKIRSINNLRALKKWLPESVMEYIETHRLF